MMGKIEEITRMRNRACEMDSHQDGVGSKVGRTWI
jgi:hypothetical protein